MSDKENSPDNGYQRVSCGFYDQLESLATLNKQVLIIHLEDEQEIQDKIHIKTFETKDKKEYLITSLGKRIRLDKIVSILEI